MVKTGQAITAIFVAFLGGIIWLGRTLWIDDLRYPFIYRVSGGDPSLNRAHLSTETELPCAKYEFIYARGSSEPSPLGYHVGPKLVNELYNQLGDSKEDILVVGLDWQATFDVPTSPLAGMERLEERVKRRAKQCPDMSFALAGYSQGAHAIRGALQNLTKHKNQIKAIAVYGDPLSSIGWPNYYAGRVLNLCNPGDRGCGGNGIVRHFVYEMSGSKLHVAAGEFIAEKIQEEGKRGGSATVKALPPVEDGPAFVIPWKAFPPPNWKVDYPGGYVAPTVGLKGVGMEEIKNWRDVL